MKTLSRFTKDFSTEIRAALRKAKTDIVSTTWLPDENGNFANGERGYLLSDGRLLNWRGVVANFSSNPPAFCH